MGILLNVLISSLVAGINQASKVSALNQTAQPAPQPVKTQPAPQPVKPQPAPVQATSAQPQFSTLREVKAYIASQSQRLATDYAFICSRVLFNRLIANDCALINSINFVSGIGFRTLSYNTTSCLIHYSQIQYYPGFKIVACAQRGDYSALNSSELALYKTALQIVQQAKFSASEPLSLEKYLHDALIRRVTYYTNADVDFQRKDTALGVLMDDRGDCDGISDAFYLLGNLAGLEVRYVSGHAPADSDTLHMWNAVKLDGAWYAVDVTWDNIEDDDSCYEPAYTYFNVGADHLRLSHNWNDLALPEPLAASTGRFHYYTAHGLIFDKWSQALQSVSHRYKTQHINAGSFVLRNCVYSQSDMKCAHQAYLNSANFCFKYKTLGKDLYVNYYLTQP